jgi:hypothetical protein
MIPLLASLHAIAAPRGDGLRPELLRLLKGPNSSFGTGFTYEHAGQETHRTPQTESDSVSARPVPTKSTIKALRRQPR